jgi:hypothetical protein
MESTTSHNSCTPHTDWYANYGTVQSRYASGQPIELAVALNMPGGSVDPLDALLLQWDKWHAVASRDA